MLFRHIRTCPYHILHPMSLAPDLLLYIHLPTLYRRILQGRRILHRRRHRQGRALRIVIRLLRIRSNDILCHASRRIGHFIDISCSEGIAQGSSAGLEEEGCWALELEE